MQYLLHWIFGWDFGGVSLEVRSEFPGCGYQCQDQLFHLWVPFFCPPQSSATIVDWLLHPVLFSYQGSTSCKVGNDQVEVRSSPSEGLTRMGGDLR